MILCSVPQIAEVWKKYWGEKKETSMSGLFYLEVFFSLTQLSIRSLGLLRIHICIC